MDENKHTISIKINFLLIILLQVALVILKTSHIIEWKWICVFLPSICFLGYVLFIIVSVVILYIQIFDKNK